jgi:peptide chain release factor 2
LSRILETRKSGLKITIKQSEMTDELQLAYEFHKEGELTAEELDEQYALVENHMMPSIQEYAG